jgi:hypothetical protein
MTVDVGGGRDPAVHEGHTHEGQGLTGGGIGYQAGDAGGLGQCAPRDQGERNARDETLGRV